MIIGWIILGSFVLCGGGCGAIFLIGAATAPTTTTTTPDADATPGERPATTTAATATSPTTAPAQPVGAAQNLSDGTTVTLHAVQDPYISSNQFLQPDAGHRFVVADVEVCSAGATALLFDWTAQTNTNRVWTPQIGEAQPLFDGPPPGQCSRGYVTFEVAVDESVVAIAFDEELTWSTIPA